MMAKYRSKTVSPLDANPTKYRSGMLSPLEANPIKYRSQVVSPSPWEPPHHYSYSHSVGGVWNFQAWAKGTYSLIQNIPLPYKQGYPGTPTGVIRENSRRETPYLDGNDCVYLLSGSSPPVYTSSLIRMNLLTYEVALCTIPAGDNQVGFTDGYIVGDHAYVSKYSAYTIPKFYKIHLPTLTNVGSGGVNTTQPAHAIHVNAEANRIYILKDSYAPYNTKVERYDYTSHGYIDITTIAPGAVGFTNRPGFIRVNNTLYYLSWVSNTAGTGNGRLVKFDLPNFSNINSVVLGSGEGRSLSIDSSGSYGYVLSVTHIYKYDLQSLTVVDSLAIPAPTNPRSMFVDEGANRLFLMENTPIALQFRVFQLSPLVYIQGYSTVYSVMTFCFPT